MLTKRIIPCLDIKNRWVVKGVKFRDHLIMGDILEFTKRYVNAGADELVFYDIAASGEQRCVNSNWISKVAELLDIPFCVAGGIRNISDAEKILAAGADKISINSPALERPAFIDELVAVFGSQCVVVGIDSQFQDNNYKVFQYTGDERKTINSQRNTIDWINEVQQRGAGEIVLNCMNSDGVRNGYDIEQIIKMQEVLHIPIIASGGAGTMAHFYEVFQYTEVSGALAASVFHNQLISISDLKNFLSSKDIRVRI